MEEKNLQLDRLVFFSDAVVAIAITLLALDIKIAPTSNGHLAFSDITGEWKTFAAFLLSFFNIANFWKVHHEFFSYFKKIDEKLLWVNIAWLFCIVLLPFSTSLVSGYFGDPPAVFFYSLNTFLIAICQNFLWDYPSDKAAFIKENTITDAVIGQMRIYCNLDMANALLAVGISLYYPTLAFILLFTKLPMILLAWMLYRKDLRQVRKNSANR